MKKLILAVALMMSAPTMAERADCNDMAELAESIMTSRQQGIPITKLLGALKDDTFKGMVTVAYEQPRWHTKASQQRAITEFANEVYLICDKNR